MSKKSILLLLGLAILVALLSIGLKRRSQVQKVSGTIETDEIHVASRYGGRVDKIHVEEGDTLTGGQLIVELEATELKAQRAQAAARLAELEKGPRAEEIATASHEWEALKADLEFARTDAKRAQELFEHKTISETDLDRAASRARALEQNAAAAKARYDLLRAGTRPEEIDQARAQLAVIDAQLGEMRVVAPTNCVLEVLSVKVGDVLPPNREVATLILPQHLWMRVYVPELWLGAIKLGELVKIEVDSFPGRQFQGMVEQVNRQAEFTPRNVQTPAERIKQVFGVKLRLPSESGLLRPGLSAEASFPGVPPLP